MKHADTIIVSDIHLGSEISRVKDLMETLEGYSYDRLILLGDIFDDLNFSRLRRCHWDFLSYVRKVSTQREVIWVEGNHDSGLFEVVPHLLGVKACSEYVWEYNGVKHLAIHGHQFDRFVLNNGRITALASHIYRIAQKIDTSRFIVSRFLQRKSTTWLRLSMKVAYDAVRYGTPKGVRYVFCGHTHQAMSLIIDNVYYFNAGCWTDRPASFISITSGGVHLHKID
jgi:UDP-2,3-diacylglucosamine pyrophosphatase LpxH